MTDSTLGEHEIPPEKNPLLNDKVYTVLELAARVWLPALATLYLALATLWHFPGGPEVVGTIVALDTFLGVFIGVAQKSYDASSAAYNGTIDVTPGDAGAALSNLVLDKDPGDMSKLVLKVNTVPTS